MVGLQLANLSLYLLISSVMYLFVLYITFNLLSQLTVLFSLCIELRAQVCNFVRLFSFSVYLSPMFICNFFAFDYLYIDSFDAVARVI